MLNKKLRVLTFIYDDNATLRDRLESLAPTEFKDCPDFRASLVLWEYQEWRGREVRRVMTDAMERLDWQDFQGLKESLVSLASLALEVLLASQAQLDHLAMMLPQGLRQSPGASSSQPTPRRPRPPSVPLAPCHSGRATPCCTS